MKWVVHSGIQAQQSMIIGHLAIQIYSARPALLHELFHLFLPRYLHLWMNKLKKHHVLLQLIFLMYSSEWHFLHNRKLTIC